MNTDPCTPPRKSRKVILQFVAGLVSGAVVSLGALTLLGDGHFDADDPSRVIALLTGLVLALIATLVAFGIAAPRQGAMLLNVEDAEELVEERKPLAQGALVMFSAAVGLLALALAAVGGSAGLLPPGVALAIAAASFVATGVLGHVSRGATDELMRELSAEAACVTLYAVLAVAAAWGSLAHLGYVPWITPLGLLAGLVGLQLLATFYVVGRRGMLASR